MDPQQRSQRQQIQAKLSNGKQTFWTACPYCNVRYLYQRDIENRTLRCQHCMNPFIAYDTDGRQGIPSKDNNLLLSRKNEGLSDQDSYKMHSKSTVKNVPSSMRLQGNFDNSNIESRPFGKTKGTSEDDGDSKTEDANLQIKDEKGRKGCLELDPKRSSPLQESLPYGNAKVNNECKNNEKEAAAVDDNKDGSEVYIDLNSGLQNEPDREIIEIPDSEFFDFDQDKSEECFEVDQMWAIYDDKDGMPRLYARIRKVFSPGFRAQITWLEPHPEERYENDWNTANLPIACGKFQHEKSEITEDFGMFSHTVDWEKGTTRGSYRIYPRKGETWALFKNWDIKWSSDPDNHRNYEYEFVKVMSDYTKESGINVAYLAKIKGFVSLFKRNNGIDFFQIPPNELYRFSHRVPSFKTTGREREDVPTGYFELDPASLPGNLDEISNHFDVDVDVDIFDDKTSGSSKSLAAKKPNMPKKRKNPCDMLPEFYNFKDDKSEEKFKPGQIWALYCELDGYPKYYAQIERVELSPNFKLYMKWLEACGPKGVIQWLDKKMPMCCGSFTSGENVEFYDTTSFSHQLTGVSDFKGNKYEIYPRKGEVWALYRNFNSGWTCSDLQKCEYDMVEVLEVYGDCWIIVLNLQQVAGFKTIFKSKRNAGHDFIMGIPWIDLFRFSHQVPAFRLTEPKYGSLRGCWELDPKSIVACLVPSN